MVSLQDTNIITDIDGRVELEILAGEYKIKVCFIGCESIEKYINFKPYTRTEIKVYLGEEDNSMGLPKDLYEKPWKYKGPVY